MTYRDRKRTRSTCSRSVARMYANVG